jgi:predicted DNA-binding protein
MSAITVRIPDSLERDLNVVAKYQDRPKSRIIKQAMQNYILDIMEDIEDIRDAEEAIARIEAGGKTYSWEEVQRDCGLLDD